MIEIVVKMREEEMIEEKMTIEMIEEEMIIEIEGMIEEEMIIEMIEEEMIEEEGEYELVEFFFDFKYSFM
jgi:hypothetical protein